MQWVQGWFTTENWTEHLYHNFLHRNEMQWVQGWSSTESWIEHLYHIGHTEMKYIGCKVGPPQKIGSSICIILATPNCNTVGARLVHHRELDRAFVSHWAHRNEMQWVQGWSTTESWIEPLYHIGYTEMKCSGCKVGPPQKAGSSICTTLATPK